MVHRLVCLHHPNSQDTPTSLFDSHESFISRYTPKILAPYHSHSLPPRLRIARHSPRLLMPLFFRMGNSVVRHEGFGCEPGCKFCDGTITGMRYRKRVRVTASDPPPTSLLCESFNPANPLHKPGIMVAARGKRATTARPISSSAPTVIRTKSTQKICARKRGRNTSTMQTPPLCSTCTILSIHQTACGEKWLKTQRFFRRFFADLDLSQIFWIFRSKPRSRSTLATAASFRASTASGPRTK